MNWFDVPKEEPSITFPIGAVIADQKAKMKILEGPIVQKTIHKYKVQILERYQEVPRDVREWKAVYESDKPQDWEWMIVLAQNLPHIRRLE